MRRFKSSIKLSGKDYRMVKSSDVVAFSCGWLVYLITRDSKIYSLDLWTDPSWSNNKHLCEIIPILGDADDDVPFSRAIYGDWHTECTGLSNWLWLRKDMEEEWLAAKGNRTKSEVHRDWDDLIIEILDRHKKTD